MTREQRIEAYLRDFAQLSPQDQRVHYQFALDWIRTNLIRRAEEIRINDTFTDITKGLDL